jgi:N-acetyl-gamma-glutamyl-phosphate reductase
MGHKAVVLGASGFGGLELLRLLDPHPGIEVVAAAASAKVGAKPSEVDARFPVGSDPTFVSIDAALDVDADIVFSSLPSGMSAELLAASQTPVIDLSGDFRLKDSADYEAWYGWKHPNPTSLDVWTYGLTEFHRNEIAKSRAVADPGCYAALAILCIGPLVKAGLIATDGLHLDAKSGTSGAGRADQTGVTDGGGVRPYKPTGHQHIVEIEQELSLLGVGEVKVSFVPHVVPMFRGIAMTCFLKPHGSLHGALGDALADHYSNEPFVHVRTEGDPDTERVLETNSVEIFYSVDERSGTWIVLGTLDNLGKGAAGQAVQNANLMLGYPEETALVSSRV